MWRRALLAAAAVSYLICVLIMSGMQKEDLDVSMLRKLQRYNVNFDDINNEQIRRQCATRDNDLSTDVEKNNSKEAYVLTTEYASTITTKDLLPSASLTVDSVLNYLKAREYPKKDSDVTPTTRTTTPPHQHTVTHVADINENQPKIDMDLFRRYIQLGTQKKSLYKLDENMESFQTKHDTAINLKTNERISNVANDAASIDKIIKDYLLKKPEVQTTTEYTTTRFTIDIKNIYKQIDEIIANGSNKHNREGKAVDNNFDKGEQSDNKQKVDSVGKDLFQGFFNFLDEMKRFKNSTSKPITTSDDNMYRINKQQKNKLFGRNKQNDQDNESSTAKYDSNIELNEKTLTPRLVKEIAETVKNVIFTDLRNELADVYFKTSTQVTPTITTTEISPTVISKTRAQEKNVAIIDKFMDLYEQIKSLKQATFLLKANNESAAFVNNLKQPNKPSVKDAMLTPSVNGLQIPETKVPIPSIGNYNTQFYKQNSYLPRKEANPRLPITIQTNSVEIQPLVIPLSKPESLIRQNIVVQTRHHAKGKSDQRFRQFSPRGNRYSDTDILMKHKNRTYNTPLKVYDGYKSPRYSPYNLQEPKQREDVIRFRMRNNGNTRLDTDYYEKINFENGRNGVKDRHGIFNNRNIPRFHERLERVDTGSDVIPIGSDVDVAAKEEPDANFPSRHQLSLLEMKRGARYDDTHFKNFLKTQQKVTDMLERILATKSKTNTPRSVETA